MSDVYSIQTVLTLGGNLAPELAKILKNMTAVDKAAKSVEKSIGRWNTPIDRTAASMGRIAREMGNVHRSASRVEREVVKVGRGMSNLKAPAAGLDREMAKWATAIGRPLAEMRTMRTATQGVSSAARGVTRSIDSWAGKINSAAAAMRRMASAAAGVHSPTASGGGYGSGRRGSSRGSGGSTTLRRRAHGRQFGEHEGSHLAGTMGVYGGINTMEYLIDQGAGGARENLRAKNAGLTAEENARLRAKATEMSQVYPSLSQLGVREQGRLLIPNVGNYDTAMKVLPEYLKGQVALQTIAGPTEGAKDMEAFARYIDVIGRSMSPDDTNKLIDGYVRSRQLDSEAVRSNDYVNAAKSAASPGKALNVDFWSRIAPALMSQQGGARTGTDLASAYQNTAIGRGTNEALFAQNSSGWREGFKSHTSKKGKQIVDNKGSLVDETMYNSNPYEWAKKHVVPEMVKRGMLPDGYAKGDYSQDLTDKQRADGGKFISERFSNRRGANIFSMMIQDMDQIEQFVKRWEKTRGTKDVLSDQKNDPYIGGQAVKTQAGNAASALAGPAMEQITNIAGRLAAALGGLADTLEKHPIAAHTAFGTGAAVVGGVSIAGVTALTIAAAGTLSLPALAIGTIGALTIGALTIPWGDIKNSILGLENGDGVGRSAHLDAMHRAQLRKNLKVGPNDFTLGLPGVAVPGAKVMPDYQEPGIGSRLWGAFSRGTRNGASSGVPSMFGGKAAEGSTPGTTWSEGMGGAPAAIKQAGDAIGQAGSAAGQSAGGFEKAASGAKQAADAANGAGGALAGLAAKISGLGNISLPGGVKASGAGAAGAPASPGAPAAGAPPAGGGKSSSVIYRGNAGAPIQVASTIMMDGRAVGRSVTQHQVAAADTQNGTGLFDDQGLKTPVGYSAPIMA